MQAFFVRADDRLNARWGQLVRRLPREIYLDVYWTIKFQGPLSRVGWNLTESATRVEIFGYPLWKEYFEREKEREREKGGLYALFYDRIKIPLHHTWYFTFHLQRLENLWKLFFTPREESYTQSHLLRNCWNSRESIDFATAIKKGEKRRKDRCCSNFIRYESKCPRRGTNSTKYLVSKRRVKEG